MGASGSKARRPLTKEGRLAGTKFDDVELHVISLTYKDLAGLSKGDKGGESIDKATFLQNFPVPGLVGDRLFHALDSNKSGRISFDDFVVGLAVCCRGTLEEKMQFLFGVYDMNEDGLIGRDELLLMLNQVPRTLLNMGMEPVDRSPLDWGSLTLDGESKTTGGGLDPALAMTTPRVGSFSHGDDFFGGGADEGAPPSMSSARGRRRGGGGASLAGGYVTPTADKGPRSMFTNEGIADQALREFGEGSDKSLTFDQFQRWAQSTPAVQALLQGAFPSDAHFSLATSPSARRSTCETLLTFDSPRRSSAVSALPFTTPRRTRESKSAATAISAMTAWSASASARPAPMGGGGVGGSSSSSNGNGGGGGGGRQGPPLRLRSMGGEDTFLSSIGGGGGGEQQQPPMGLMTPSRTLSRNTSYGNLLRSPLVGHGLRGPAAMSPRPRGFFNAVGGPAGAGEGGGSTATAKGRGWGGEESLKTPKPGASGLGRTWGEDELRRADGGKGGGGGGVRKDRERNIPPTPITTGRTRRRT
ncbi:unnamed protein product, partial [Ectocarpus sp. 6 AP-2014]